MSQENIDLAHRCYEALHADDIERFLTYLDPDIEFTSLILEIEGTFHGHDGVREWWSGLRDVFPDWKPSLVEVRAAGPYVIARAHGSGSGSGSGISIDDEFWQVVEVRNGKVIWYRAVRTEREALDAAGLSE
jgi:ketosteroid isomerase-like protein